ncbi:ArsR/SmtB family transcription factor [Portibacter marinus]|uniref:ArsR/SmtB family transcription factor n=1 Tax=Portibacter marinus TaxID=2898660 RepID=UPI001F48DF47|nr:metalloregulator ArsR/SmtB family transcription factor [Portibacter marinus]
MGISKTELFTPEQNEIASIAKAIAHPARIAILQYLVDVNSCVCGEIVDEIGLSQSTISQHLKELKKMDIIKGEVEGVKVCYCINRQKMDSIRILFNQIFKQFSCC